MIVTIQFFFQKFKNNSNGVNNRTSAAQSVFSHQQYVNFVLFCRIDEETQRERERDVSMPQCNATEDEREREKKETTVSHGCSDN